MGVWSQIDPSKAHVAYACVGIFSAIFSLVSLFFKEKLFIGESTIAGIFGLIYGPHALNWFDPSTWGNSDSITLEITRIVLCIQIFAVAVELPKRYMLRHWLSVFLLLVPVMTAGWLIIGLFVWIVIPHINFSDGLLISACITATDPILAQSVVSGKFAQKVPGHLRNLLSAESGCNDGMAFPFIFLSLDLILHHGKGGVIVKDWICITILWECGFGCILGCVIGYIGKTSIKFAEEYKMVDRESFLAFYIVLAFICAGFGSILGVDDLLVSFAAGATFAWDGWFSEKTKESGISTVIDLLLNFAYFIYFGAIIPWEQYDNPVIGLSVWRLIVLAFVVIFLRRIPAVLALKPFIPDIKSWREALFVGHFGPIGVGAVFAAITCRIDLLEDAGNEDLSLKDLPVRGTKHWRLISILWPVVSFFIVTSIVVHGSSVAVATLGRHLNTITLTKTFSAHTTFANTKSSWLQRLPSLDKNGRSFSLHRVDTDATKTTSGNNNAPSGTNGVETSGIPYRHAGGITKEQLKKKRKKARRARRKRIFDRSRRGSFFNDYDTELNDLGREQLQREKEAMAGTFLLSGHKDTPNPEEDGHLHGILSDADRVSSFRRPSVPGITSATPSIHFTATETETETDINATESESRSTMASATISPDDNSRSSESYPSEKKSMGESEAEASPHVAYADGNQIILEDAEGEIVQVVNVNDSNTAGDEESGMGRTLSKTSSKTSSLPGSLIGQGLSELKKVISPTRILPERRKLEKPKSHKKYFAYKIDNLLIIENDEGDVLRRYEINHHKKGGNQLLGAGGKVVGKALNVMGIKKNKKKSNGIENISAVNHDPDLAPSLRRRLRPFIDNGSISQPDEEDDDYEDEDYYNYSNNDDEESYSDYAFDDEGSYSDEDSSDSQSDVSPRGTSRVGSAQRSYSDDSYIDSYDDDDEETAFEKQRRLNALGLQNVPRKEEDEEEENLQVSFAPPPRRTSVSSQKATKRSSSIRRTITNKFKKKSSITNDE